MSSIKLITDSDCDLSDQMAEQYDIEIVRLYINFGEKSYKDGLDIKAENIYDMIDEFKDLPKTAAASPGDFGVIFQKYLDMGKKVLYIGVSSKLSATLNNALIAKDMLNSDDIFIIDSKTISSGMALLVLKAVKFISEKKAIEEIYAKINEMVPKVRCQFTIDTLEYLYKGGRLNSLSHFMGSILRIKPIIRVIDGSMSVGKKAIGNSRKALDMMIQDLLEEKELIDPDNLFITHSLAHDYYEYILNKIHDKVSVSTIHEAKVGCGISCHCGKKTIGLIYLLK